MAVRKNGVLDADLTDLRRLQEFDTLNIQVTGGMVGRYADIHNYWSMVIAHRHFYHYPWCTITPFI